jgi:hypothetical protein
MNKPLDCDELIKPYREKRKLDKSVTKRRIMPTHTKQDIIAGLMEAGYTESEAEHWFNLIDEVKRGKLGEEKGEE